MITTDTIQSGRVQKAPENFLDRSGIQTVIAESKAGRRHFIRNVGGDGNDIYRPKGRINTAGLLRGMVEYCNTQLNLGFFPEDTNAVAAVLNKQHYKFK